MSLSPEQRDDLRQLLEDELRAAWRAAVERGVPPEEVAELVADRRRAVAAAFGVADDDPVPGRAAGEQR
jgi:hypothetical protein